jgi:hypothetical protein
LAERSPSKSPMSVSLIGSSWKTLKLSWRDPRRQQLSERCGILMSKD